MEMNFFEKIMNVFNNTNKFTKDLYTEKKDSNLANGKDKQFHLDCKYSRKKICHCKFFESKDTSKKDFGDFLIDLVNDEIDIDFNKKNLEFVRKNIDHTKIQKEINQERIKNMNYQTARNLILDYKESNLTLADYREIEKNINEDKKICENCKTNIYENNYHKGWKKEDGEYVLLCSTCSKKYFNGALEIKFDKDQLIKRDDMIPVNKPSSNSIKISTDGIYQVHHNVLPPPTTITSIIKIFKKLEPSFQVIPATPYGQDMLGGKRPGAELDIICFNKKCNKTGKKSDFLCCAKCEKYYHPGCLDLPMLMKYVNRFKWYCMNCKTCQHCFNNAATTSENRLIKCNTCDRTFHNYCYGMIPYASLLNPNSTLPTPQQGSMSKHFCVDCINCKNCNKTLPVLSYNNSHDFKQIKGYRVCDDCWKYYTNKHYCPKCLKIYKGQVDSNKVYCNKCLNFYHADCEGLTQEEAIEKSRTKNNYACTICRES